VSLAIFVKTAMLRVAWDWQKIYRTILEKDMFLPVRDGAEFKNKHICPLGHMVFFLPADKKKRVSQKHTCSTVVTLLINTTH
jgi:hypothetical protein